jgi:two-component system, NarL family, sensor histidine kinase UhpB
MVNSKFRSQLLETRLEARDSQLQLAADAAELGFWSWEPTTGALAASARSLALMSMPAAAAADFDAFLSQVEPTDQGRVRRSFALALQHRREFNVEFQISSAAGTRRVRCTGTPHASAMDRQQPAMSGIVQEIHETPVADHELLATRVGSMAFRMESLREIDRATLVNRMKSEVAQNLGSIQQELQALGADTALPAATRAKLAALAAEAAAGLEAVRSAIFELRPPGVEELGFAGALERYATEQAAAAGLELSLHLPTESLPLDTQGLEALYLVARAGIDNVVRHANARRMQVLVNADANEVSLKIMDDGTGIADNDLMKDSAFSLFASSERISNAGGELRVNGKPGQGTTLEASIALRNRIRPLRSKVTPLRVA